MPPTPEIRTPQIFKATASISRKPTCRTISPPYNSYTGPISTPIIQTPPICDGMADIVGFAQGGAYVSLATGNGSFAGPTLGSNTSFWGAQTGGWSSNDLYPRE